MARITALARRAGTGIRAGAGKARGGLARVGARAAVGIRRARESESVTGAAIGVSAVTAIVAVDELTGLPPGISAAGATIVIVGGGAAGGAKAKRALRDAANMAGGIALYFAERAVIRFVRDRPAPVAGDF